MRGLAWPTIALAIVAVATATATLLACGMRLISLPVALLLATSAAWLAFTPLHEAVHGNIGSPLLERVIGWACGALLFAPFSSFQRLHLQHHAYTNDPRRDPDAWVAGTTFLAVAARCCTLLARYYQWFLAGRVSGPPRPLWPLLLFHSAWISAAVIAGFSGRADVVLVWLASAWMASSALGFTFNWLPHHPHLVSGVQTRRLHVGWLSVLMFQQDFHDVHHAWPRVPFYRYRSLAPGSSKIFDGRIQSDTGEH